MKRARIGSRLGCLALCLLFILPPAAVAQPFAMGMVDNEASFVAKWYGRIYLEAFRRLGLRVDLVSYPTQRIGVVLDQGLIDGEAARARIYADAHPELIRVDESLFDVTFGLFATNPAVELRRVEDLAAQKLRVGYRRGVLVCENTLVPVLPADQLADVTRVDQGLMMLAAGRSDVFCDNDIAVASALDVPELKGVTTIRQVLVLNVVPLYPYLHRRHAVLAPRLAATLKQMKAEGLIERYRLEALREAGR